MELINDPALSKDDQITKLKSLCSQLPSFKLELYNDLKGLIKSLQSSEKTSAGDPVTAQVDDVETSSSEKATLCSDWEDLFLAGSEVEGSCQRVDGNPDYNKCLLAYCLDGKNAMLAVKGTEGKILARSMLRLLWNQTDSKPVLFLDRLYPTPCPKEREDAILKAAIIAAKSLGLELFTSWKNGPPTQEKIIESLGSSCPYEYADGADGVMSDGLFTIQHPRKIDLT